MSSTCVCVTMMLATYENEVFKKRILNKNLKKSKRYMQIQELISVIIRNINALKISLLFF